MARRQDGGSSGKDSLIDRRSLLQAVGGAAATVALGSTVAGLSAQRVRAAETVVDLGEEGLTSGDNIDSYLEEHFVSGNEVHIPAGEYNFSSDEALGGDKSDCALVGSPEGVVLHRPDDPEETVRPSLNAESGTVRVENLTIKGKHGQEQSRWRMEAQESATIEVVNVNFPDGTVEGSDSTGIYGGSEHAGTLWVKSCYFSNFGNVALYVSDAYEGGGPVIVEDCAFVNTGMSSLRFASDGSICRGCYFEATEKGPEGNTGWNQRGIKIDDPGEDVLFEDIDMYWTDVATYPIQFDDKGEGGAGVMRNVRIYNDSDNATFKLQWEGVSDNWEGENIHLTGGAEHNAPESFETVTGNEAKKPKREYDIWTPVEDASGPDESTGN